MGEEPDSEITTLLNNNDVLEPATVSRLEQLVYRDLKRIAASKIAQESASSTMTVTALVHEAFMRLESSDKMMWKSRRHYFGAAAEAMRRILIDRARYYLRKRREGAKSALSLDEGLIVEGVKPAELVKLDDALADLESFDEQLAAILKLKYFAGLSAREIAEVFEVSTRTMTRRIEAGRAWLLTEMS